MNSSACTLLALLLAAPPALAGAERASAAPPPPRSAYDLPSVPAGDPAVKQLRTRTEVAGSARQALARYADRASAAAGFLDVTKAPYQARGDGITDDTAALQRALIHARDARLVVWLPPGTYLVRDTLQCVQGGIDRRSPLPPRAGGATAEPPEGERLRANDYPSVLRGPAGPRRAVIRLAPDARGFGNPLRPRPLIFIWARRWDPPYDLQPNVSFNQMLISVDVDVRGHAGAVAVDMQGAQGTAVQDVSIEADGAFAGIRGLAGSGGSTHQVTVRGGRYGIYAAGIGDFARLSGSQPSPLLAAATLTGQSVAAIHYAGRGPLTVVGAKIQGRGIVCAGGREFYNGALNVVDSTLEIAGGPLVTSDRPVYLGNCFVRGASALVHFPNAAPVALASGGWSQIREFAGAPAGPFPIWVERTKQAGTVQDILAGAAPPADFAARHHLPQLPGWNEPGVANAGAPPYQAIGDNTGDAAPAIQRALDEHAVVFLPKGRYRLGQPLRLAPGRKLIGASRTLTRLSAQPGAKAFADAAAPQPLIDAADAPDADTMIALLSVAVSSPGAYALRWHAGARSVVRDVNFNAGGSAEGARAPQILVEGSGGGRWYNLFFSDAVAAPDYRQILVRGTRQPLAFYMFNPEHGRSEVMTEFVDTRDVTIYALKAETFVIGFPERGTRPLVHVRDSAGFRLYGGGGICGAAPRDRPWVYRFENSRDILVANAGHQFSQTYFGEPRAWSFVVDVGPDAETKTPGNEYFALYRRR